MASRAIARLHEADLSESVNQPLRKVRDQIYLPPFFQFLYTTVRAMLKSTYKAAVPTAAEGALLEGWTEHTAPSGHKYYHNTSTKQSTYTRPVVENDEPLQIDFSATEPDHVIRASLLAQDEFQKNSRVDPRGQGHFTGGASYQNHPRRRGHGGDRPKSKAPIPDCAPWILVKTKFGRRFVHNTETKQSLWKFPQDVMMAVIEMDRMDWEAKREQENAPEQVKRPEPASQPEPPPQARHEDDSDSYEEVEVTDSEGEGEGRDADPSAKRPRLSPTGPDVPPGPVEFDEDDIEWQLAQMEAYADDDEMQDEDEGLPMTDEDNIALFRSLLDDFHISPYSTFEKVLEDASLIEDDRYIALPNMHRRKEVFVNWSRDRVAESQQRQAEQESKQVDPKIEYLRFLQQHASTKLFWPEFKRKYRKEDVMKAYELSEKEREKVYREYVGKMKMKESEKRKDLLACLKGAGLEKRSDVNALPESVLKDARFYLMHEKNRDEVVEDFLSTLPI